MIQNNVIVCDLVELKKKIPDIKNFFENIEYTDGVIEVFIGNIPEKDISEILRLIVDSFPKMKVIGFSVAQQVILYGVESAIALNFSVMKQSKTDSFCKEIDTSDNNFVEDCLDYARELNKKMKAMENVKAIEVYFSYLKASAAEFLDILTEGLDEVQVFGAIAAGNKMSDIKDYITVGNDDSFVIAGNYYGPGVSGVIYRGDELYVYTDYLFGWEPVGRYMDVSSQTISNYGTTTLMSIDGMKPTEVYKKYLGVEPNDYFIPNIGEFPLVIERDGVLIGRTPSAFGENGEVYLEGDLYDNEKVRFSYGEVGEILNNTKNAACRMESFGAERLSLIICGNRFNFLQEDYNLEIEYYSEGKVKSPNVILGMGEIYKYHGKGGILNSALVAVGMREGLGNEMASPILTPNSLYRYHNIIPLSERLSHFLKAMTGELVDAVHEAKSANNAKSEFLSNMSHEIRTPINAVLGMDEMILRECEDPQIQEYAQNIKNASNTLLSLVNDILDFSKIEAGKMDIIPVDYDFSSVLNDLIHMIKPRLDAKGLELSVEIDKNAPSVLNGDEIRIKQVITNLLSNAVKYTEKGSVGISINCKKTSENTVDFIVSVKDTGIGIRPEDINRLFSAFQRVDEVRNRTIQGTGLGLNISRKLLSLMGSELKVTSEYGRGSEFSFILNQRVVKWEPVGDYVESYRQAIRARKVYKEKFTAPGAEVLVVDDTAMNLSVFSGLLKKTLVKIDEAESGMQCLDMTRKKKYDLIFLDHRMPKMDGIETLKIMKSEEDNLNRSTPVISLTANAVSGAREQYIEAGFIDYLTKPIVSEKLESLMISYLPKEKVKLEKDSEEKDENDKGKLPDWLDNVEGIDKREGIKNCGSSDLYLNALESFVNAAEENHNKIEKYFKSEAIADYTIKVHALKSSARIIGAMELSKLAESMEKAGDAKNFDAIKMGTPRLMSMYMNIFEGLKRNYKKADDSSLPLIGKEQIKEAIDSIKELSLVFDYDSIKYIIDSISVYRVPDDLNERFSRLKEAINNADWDKIKIVLEEF